jgi:hypothetical protein
MMYLLIGSNLFISIAFKRGHPSYNATFPNVAEGEALWEEDYRREDNNI